MNHRLRLRVSALALLLSVGFLGGCASSTSKTTTSTPPPTNPTPVVISVSPTSAAIATGGTTIFQANLTGDTAATWTVDGVANGNTTVGTITTSGLQATFQGPSGATGEVATIVATSVADTTKSATATVYVVPPGQVAATANTLVATYTISPPTAAAVHVQFGTDTTYGRRTNDLAAPSAGGTVSTFVAGMLASTLYHMQAVVQFPDGTLFLDADQVFTTAAIPTADLVTVTTATTAGMTPQSGVEMLDTIGNGANAFVTDLNGNIIWYYPLNVSGGTIVQPLRPLPNGHFLITLSPTSAIALTPPVPANLTDEIREIDLAGNTIRSLNIVDLNTKLAAAGFSLTAQVIHHDAIQLANGHWVFLVAVTQSFTELPGYPGTTLVLGDAIVDVDTNFNPVWVWNTFDHLDVKRHPYNFPDWTHSNALLYTYDGNLLLSMRHQNWIIKIDYANGRGAGDILWHLGQGGDFTLVGGTDPTDWPYLQHGPAFFGANGIVRGFELGVMDNGGDRAYPNGESCEAAGFTVCPFSAVPIYAIDEDALTATLVFDDRLSQYSYFGGDVRPLENGDVEFDLCSDDTVAGTNAVVYEVTRSDTPQVVWKMNITGQNAYRAFRIRSLYPGVQW
jgi:hypothetical protein